jgi:hypothetical protein
MRYKILVIGAVVLLCVTAALAADVTGKWVAQVTSARGTSETTFNFKQDGAKLTGTIGTQMGESPISEGKVQGDDVSFTQTMSFGGNEMKFVWKGKVSGDEIKFTRTMEGGMPGGGPGGGGPGGGAGAGAGGGGGQGGGQGAGRGPGGPQEIVAKRAK